MIDRSKNRGLAVPCTLKDGLAGRRAVDCQKKNGKLTAPIEYKANLITVSGLVPRRRSATPYPFGSH